MIIGLFAGLIFLFFYDAYVERALRKPLTDRQIYWLQVQQWCASILVLLWLAFAFYVIGLQR